MKDRSASKTLLGYYYQFDKSIIEILQNSNEKAKFTVEGIEDIDIDSVSQEYIQCKYVKSTNLTPSSISEALAYLYRAYKSKKCRVRLYGYFKKSNKIDFNFIKKALKLEKARKILQVDPTDSDIVAFRGLFSHEIGLDFNTQHQKCIELLKNQFDCTNNEEAELLFYPKSLELIFSIAVRDDVALRCITKNDFVNKINKSKEVFFVLSKFFKNKVDYIKFLRRNITEKHNLKPVKSKYVFICVDSNNEINIVTDLVIDLCEEYYNKNEIFPSDSVPLTFIIETSNSILHMIKSEILKRKYTFNDGQESWGIFDVEVFNKKPIVNKNLAGNCIKLSSYYVKIISFVEWKKNVKKIETPDVSFNFSNKELPYRCVYNFNPDQRNDMFKILKK